MNIGPFKQKQICVKLRLFSYPPVLTCVLGAQKNPFIETVPLSTHNIMFPYRNKKNIFLVRPEFFY